LRLVFVITPLLESFVVIPSIRFCQQSRMLGMGYANDFTSQHFCGIILRCLCQN
jgi:hypothetical protein